MAFVELVCFRAPKSASVVQNFVGRVILIVGIVILSMPERTKIRGTSVPR